MTSQPVALLRAAFGDAVRAARPDDAVRALDLEGLRETSLVVGAGKAAVGMARGLEENAGRPLRGLVITPTGHVGASPQGVQVAEAGHPVPTAAGVSATRRILALLAAFGPEDRAVVLISGGASALLTAPRGVTPEQKAALTEDLLASGASIEEINVVRKHLSNVKGGGLAAATRARLLSLIVSDVVGDALSAIGSGPTAPDPSTYAEALEVLSRYGLEHPEARAVFEKGARGALPETPKADHPAFKRVENRLIVTNAGALAAAQKTLRAAGLWRARPERRGHGQRAGRSAAVTRRRRGTCPRAARFSRGARRPRDRDPAAGAAGAT